MKIEVHHIPSQGLALASDEAAASFGSLKELMDRHVCHFTASISINLHVEPARDMIRVKGCFETVVREACARCLENFEHPLKAEFRLNYSKKIPSDLHREEKEDIALTAQQIGMIYYDGDEIDFSEALQEQVVLAMPYRPLCREDCKGLCSKCGQDLNKSACQCEQKPAEGPFAVLKNLKLRSDKEIKA